MRHDNSQPQHYEILGTIAVAFPNFQPVAARSKADRVCAASYYPCVSGIDFPELAFSPVGKKQRKVHLAVLDPVINVKQPMDDRSEDSNRLASLGPVVKGRDIIAHP